MEGGAISTTGRRCTTRPCNLSRDETQPAVLRCALASVRGCWSPESDRRRPPHRRTAVSSALPCRAIYLATRPSPRCCAARWRRCGLLVSGGSRGRPATGDRRSPRHHATTPPRHRAAAPLRRCATAWGCARWNTPETGRVIGLICETARMMQRRGSIQAIVVVSALALGGGCYHAVLRAGGQAGPEQTRTGWNLFWGIADANFDISDCPNGVAYAEVWRPWWGSFRSSSRSASRRRSASRTCARRRSVACSRSIRRRRGDAQLGYPPRARAAALAWSCRSPSRPSSGPAPDCTPTRMASPLAAHVALCTLESWCSVLTWRLAASSVLHLVVAHVCPRDAAVGRAPVRNRQCMIGRYTWLTGTDVVQINHPMVSG